MSKQNGKSLSSVNIDSLDRLERRWYEDFTSKGRSKEDALKIIINTVEGDISQLSPELRGTSYAQEEANDSNSFQNSQMPSRRNWLSAKVARGSDRYASKKENASVEKRSTYRDVSYRIMYEVHKGYWVEGDGISPSAIFDKMDEAVEHAEMEIEGMSKSQ